ncbi:unnamed protein product, partial [Phaeothamnion confervicola]
ENGKRASRRRLLLGSAGLAPVAMTFSSPALATLSTSCGGGGVFTPSGAVSASPSRNTQQTSRGVSPGYWKNHTPWAGPTMTTTSFKTVFGSCPWSGGYGRPTVLDVLSPEKYGSGGNPVSNSTTASFARACASSLLNAESGRYTDGTGNWLSTSTIKAMWLGGIGAGWTVPGTGVV